MPMPDSESPEQSLGDCAICMDAIIVDPALRHRSKSFDAREEWEDENGTPPSVSKKGNSVGSVFNAMHIGVNATSARKNYSLAPCSHLFVSLLSLWGVAAVLNFFLKHTECLEKVGDLAMHFDWYRTNSLLLY